GYCCKKYGLLLSRSAHLFGPCRKQSLKNHNSYPWHASPHSGSAWHFVGNEHHTNPYWDIADYLVYGNSQSAWAYMRRLDRHSFWLRSNIPYVPKSSPLRVNG